MEQWGMRQKEEKTGRLRNNRKEFYEISEIQIKLGEVENEEIREIEMKRKK